MNDDKKGVKVLIVDDEEELCFLLSNMLKRKGFEVESAHSLDSGLNKFRQFDPKVAILDVNLPDGECFEIIPEIKETSGAKVIIITARDGATELRKARELGVEEFIRKPFSNKKIVETLEAIAQL